MKENLEDGQAKETLAPRRNSFRVRMVVLVLAISVGIGWLLVRKPSPISPEPMYKGRTVSAWLHDLEIGNGSECYTALEEIGPAALPFIYRKIEQHDSPWGNRWRDLWQKSPHFVQMFLPKPKWTRFNNPKAQIASQCSLEKTNLMPILNWFEDGNPAIREVAWSVVASGDGSAISTSEALSLSPPALKDNDVSVRELAVIVLGMKGAAASNMVPALIPFLSRSEKGRHGTFPVGTVETARALGRIGPVASNAIPALMNLTKSNDTYTRLSAAAALWRITSDQNVGLPIIIKELPSFDDYNRCVVIRYVMEMGPRAKALFPMLVKDLSRPTFPWDHTVIPDALKAIDPEAAAKLGVK